MTKIVTGITVLLLGGVLGWYLLSGSDGNSAESIYTGGADSTSLSALTEKVAVLETQLEEERLARLELANIVDELMSQPFIDDTAASERVASATGEADNARQAIDPQTRREQLMEQSTQRRQMREARRSERLLDAGFSQSQVEYLLQREEEIRLANLNAQWERRRQQFLEENSGQENDPLRDELSEADYERYLQATGRPTSVYISQIMTNSQAGFAGFQAGDEIVRYNGERVYNFNDLNRANVQGNLGEPVVIDVIRNGAPLQLTVERGPLGIVGGRNRGWRDR